MPVKTKNKKSKKTIHAIVDTSVGNYEKHPFFIKKANKAVSLIEKVGLPEQLSKIK